MFRMRQGLKLPHLPGVKTGKRSRYDGILQNAREKLRLGTKIFRLQAGRFAGPLDG